MANEEPVTSQTSVMGNAGGRTRTGCHDGAADKRNGGGSVQNRRRIEECYSPM